MINRWIGIVTLALMLSVNAALLLRDVLPDWLAGEPPTSRALQLEPGGEIRAQYGLFDRQGRRVGYSWTTSSRSGDLIAVRNSTILQSFALPRGLRTPALRIDTNLRYHGATTLEELRVQVHGFGIPIRLDGEFVPPDTFPCEWRVDTQVGSIVLPASATRAIGDVVRPFDSLTGLRVGQSWRVELLNPLAGVLPGWGSDNVMALGSIRVRVTKLERLMHQGALTEAFRLEAESMRAWVTREGRVIQQEIDLPLFGTLRLVDEPYDENARARVIARMLGH
jgi:hypothetical protein